MIKLHYCLAFAPLKMSWSYVHCLYNLFHIAAFFALTFKLTRYMAEFLLCINFISWTTFLFANTIAVTCSVLQIFLFIKKNASIHKERGGFSTKSLSVYYCKYSFTAVIGKVPIMAEEGFCWGEICVLFIACINRLLERLNFIIFN